MIFILDTNTPQFYNDLSETIRTFFPDAEISLSEYTSIIEQDDFLLKCTLTGSDSLLAQATLQKDSAMLCSYAQKGIIPPPSGSLLSKRLSKRIVKQSVYFLLKEYTGITPPWGALTGIRPTKIAYEQIKAGENREAISKNLSRDFDLSPSKTQLLFDIIDSQQKYIEHAASDIDIYIGIPFCVSRCIYCSFSSADSLKHKQLISPYLDALYRDIAAGAEIVKNNGRTVRCIYFGGGTPTSLSAEQLQKLVTFVGENFQTPMEYTVEAGRPDTIDEEKLHILQAAGVGRISINPQTMNDRTLEAIGRQHTAADIAKAFAQARKVGFHTINADLIAGLPGEDLPMFQKTLTGILGLHPENVTVHTLSLKKGSILSEQIHAENLDGHHKVQQMVDYALTVLKQQGYAPYYLYRQKYMAGNLENIGYAKQGHAGIYNIDIMEETTDILALGSGAISKRVYPEQGRIERAANVKSIPEYIARIDEMIQRKRDLFTQA